MDLAARGFDLACSAAARSMSRSWRLTEALTRCSRLRSSWRSTAAGIPAKSPLIRFPFLKDAALAVDKRALHI